MMNGRKVITPIHKKGDKLRCTNYRGLCLIDSTYKILSNVTLSTNSPSGKYPH